MPADPPSLPSLPTGSAPPGAEAGPVLRLAGQSLHLLPERCVFWSETRTLLLADLHLGKAAHLRHHGLPVPEGHTAEDLARLDRVIRRTGASSVVLCGDFFHAPAAQSAEVLALVAAWRAGHPRITVELVTGNHDRGRAYPPAACGILAAGPSLRRGPFHLIHDPAEAPGGTEITISGHLHPAVALGAGGRQAPLKAPCFWWQASRSCLVLPGFGSFTGGSTVPFSEGDQLHAIAGGRVMELPPALLRKKRWPPATTVRRPG